MLVPEKLRALVLDLDGLIIDSETWSWQAHNTVLASYGFAPLAVDEIRTMVGLIGADEWNQLCGMRALPNARSQYGSAHTDQYLRLRDARLAPMPGVADLVHAASSLGLRLALASNSPLYSVRDTLRPMGLLDCFAALATGDQVARTKPAPDVYLLALGLLGVPACCALAIEDSAVGLRAASAAGIACIVVPNVVTTAQDLTAAHGRFDNLGDVAKWLVGGTASGQPSKQTGELDAAARPAAAGGLP